MKLLAILAVVGAVGLAGSSVTVLRREELTPDLIANPGYYIYERPDGLFDVEDLQNSTAENRFLYPRIKPTYYIFTPQNRHKGVPINSDQLPQLLELTRFNIHRKTLVVIHGWSKYHDSHSYEYIKDAALEYQNINVIVVDWKSTASWNYFSSQGSVLFIGNCVGDFLLRLSDELNHPLHQITIVGHSLGAHVAGNAGARTNGLVDTIVGLDPAGPRFEEGKTDNRLDPTDARYVHVIHTNAGLLGWGVKMGHADFFPNGGTKQPGCGLDLFGSCAHRRAWQYYAESINNNHFVSHQCDSYSAFTAKKCVRNTACLMGGFPVPRCPAGSYYLDTNSAPPFAKG